MKSARLVWLFSLFISLLGFAQSDIVSPSSQPQRFDASDMWRPQVSEPEVVPPATFAKPVLYSTGGTNAVELAVADVNGDGKLDVVAVNASGTVAVLLGNGNGTLQAAVNYDSGGSGGSSVAVADLNRDNKLDLVVASPSSVSVLLGNGDGTFQPAVVSNTGGRAVAVTDINQDGYLDAVLTTDAGISVLFGNGNGTFQPPVNTATVSSSSLAVADLNHDGKPDAVIILSSGDAGRHSRTNGTIGVLFGNGNGTFQSPITYDSLGFYPQQIVIADMNRDGSPDILVVNRLGHVNAQEGSVEVLLNNSGGAFSETLVRTDGISDFAVAAGDLNGDSVPDLAVVESGNISVVLTGGEFRHHSVLTPQKVAIADLNGDSQPDLIVATRCLDITCPAGGVAVLLSTPAPTKTTVTTSGSPSQFNQPVTFTATITSTRGPVPDGQTVTFFDSATKIGTATTTNSVAMFTTSSLKVGTHTIKAKFPGCPFFKKSYGTVTQVVNP